LEGIATLPKVTQGTNRKKPGITQVLKASRSWGANIPGGYTEKIAPAMNGPRFARISINNPTRTWLRDIFKAIGPNKGDIANEIP
jgi:hypothetical protein